MAIMEGTTSPASSSPSPSPAASSEISAKPITVSSAPEREPLGVERKTVVETTQRRGGIAAGNLRCEWDECGARFGDVHGLVEHLENGEFLGRLMVRRD